MVSYTGEELNRFFNQVDLMRNFFPHNLSTVSPFAQAIGELWRYKPESEKVDACYKRIADCFIPQSTNPDFEEAQFKKAKSHFLDVVVKELESKASRSVYEKVGCIWRIFFESCALIDRAFPKTISPYLDGHLRHFIALTTNCVDMARDIESIKKQLQEKFQEFILFCDEYKEGKDEQEVSSEIEQVVKRALEHVQKILDESLRLSKKPLCVGREPFYRARQALVLEQFRTFELEEDLDFFLSESCYEDDPHILQLKFQFFHTFYKDTVEWFDWKAFLRSEFSGRLEDDWIQALPHDTYFCFPKKFTQWVSSPEVQDKLKAVQPHSLYEQAEAECRKKVSEQCYQRLSEQLVLSSCGTPFQVERVVKSLSDEARRALEDESTASCALMPTCILTASHVLEVASIIEERIPLIKRLKALQFNDQDIQKVLSVCAGYFLLDSDFEPHTYLATMSTEQLRSFVHAIMMLFYNDDQWLKIEFSAVKPKQNNGIVSPLQHPLVPKKLPKKS